MGLVRCVVFVSLPTIHQYEAMGHKVGQSRSSLMRFALESGLADVERFVRRFRSTGEPLRSAQAVGLQVAGPSGEVSEATRGGGAASPVAVVLVERACPVARRKRRRVPPREWD